MCIAVKLLLTNDVEALEFCLEQVGNPTRFDAATRAQFRQTMISAYPGLPAEVQQNLANSESIWQRFLTRSWHPQCGKSVRSGPPENWMSMKNTFAANGCVRRC